MSFWSRKKITPKEAAAERHEKLNVRADVALIGRERDAIKQLSKIAVNMYAEERNEEKMLIDIKAKIAQSSRLVRTEGAQAFRETLLREIGLILGSELHTDSEEKSILNLRKELAAFIHSEFKLNVANTDLDKTAFDARVNAIHSAATAAPLDLAKVDNLERQIRHILTTKLKLESEIASVESSMVGLKTRFRDLISRLRLMIYSGRLFESVTIVDTLLSEMKAREKLTMDLEKITKQISRLDKTIIHDDTAVLARII